MTELPEELKESFKDIFSHPLSGLAGMSDGSDTKIFESHQVGAGDTLGNAASKGRLISGREQGYMLGDYND